MRIWRWLPLAAVLAASDAASAEVVDRSPGGFTLTWQFTPNPQGGVTATVTYAVAGQYPGGLDSVSEAVDTVIADQLRRLKVYVESSR